MTLSLSRHLSFKHRASLRVILDPRCSSFEVIPTSPLPKRYLNESGFRPEIRDSQTLRSIQPVGRTSGSAIVLRLRRSSELTFAPLNFLDPKERSVQVPSNCVELGLTLATSDRRSVTIVDEDSNSPDECPRCTACCVVTARTNLSWSHVVDWAGERSPPARRRYPRSLRDRLAARSARRYASGSKRAVKWRSADGS